MGFLTDVIALSRFQFAFTVAYHFIFVPLSIGLGLIVAILETKYYRSRKPEDAAAAHFWLKIFTTTFAIGVATGITMEFSFGTNWANYSRFVGDIFGAPLAAEALFAFFLESVFLGVLLFGRKRTSPRFYMVSAWLVWIGSLLSALWILIANSWMQTPGGAELASDGSKAIITNFFAAAFNPSTATRYSHTVLSLLVMGAFVALSVAGYYFLKKRHVEFARTTAKVGAIVGCVAAILLLVSAHATAVGVSVEQPTKLAMMEGQYKDEPAALYLFGWVDQKNQQVIAPFKIEGGTSFLATNSFDTKVPGLNSLAKTDKFKDLNPEQLPVNAVFQSYHLMVACFGLIVLVIILAFVGLKKPKLFEKKWVGRILLIAPVFPFLAIQAGWMTAEVGRQPWVVYPSTSGPDGVSMLTANAISPSVSAVELLITILLFVVVYIFLFIAWVRVISHFLHEGPVETPFAPSPKAAQKHVAAAQKATHEKAQAEGSEA